MTVVVKKVAIAALDTSISGLWRVGGTTLAYAKFDCY